MQRNLVNQFPTLMQVILICCLGFVLGIISIWVPPTLILMGIAGILYFLISWLWPEIALLLILLLTSTIFDLYSLPSIPIGVGHIIVSDVLPFILIGIIFIRGLVESRYFFTHTPLDIPLLAFYGVAMLSTIMAIANSSITFNQSLGEVRVINLYLTFFIVTNLVRNKIQLQRLLNGMFFLAVFVALAMIAQFVLGNSVQILAGGVDTLSTAGTTSYGITRVLPPGQSLILVAFISLAVLMVLHRTLPRFIVSLIQLCIVGLAVLLTFNRSFWVTIALALFVVGVLVSLRDKVNYVRIAVWLAVIGAMVFIPLLMMDKGQVGKLADSAYIRLSTLFNPNTAQEDSLQYRYVENGYALPQIAAHPLVGLGLGANYRSYDSRIDFTRNPEYNKNAYIHNGHLWVMLKTGLIGYFCLMWFMLLSLKRGLQYWKRISDPFFRGIMISFATTILGVLVATTVNPLFSAIYWAPVIGVVMGINEVIIKLNADQSINPHLNNINNG